MRIMIVDDEVLVRLGIKTIIPWDRYGHEIVAEAEDGSRALEKIEVCAPDIVMVDIRMPVMDGLQFIAKAKAQGVRCKFVVLTCLNEFEYAQKALQLGVSDYVIKTSMSSGDMLHLVNRMAAQIEKEKEGNRLMRAGETSQDRPSLEPVKEAFRCGSADTAALPALLEACDPGLIAPGLYVVSLQIAHSEALKKMLEGNADRLYNRGVLNICTELFRHYGTGIIFEEEERCYAAVVALKRGAPGHDAAMADLGRRIAETVRTLLAFEVKIGASRMLPDATHLVNGYREAVRARERLFFHESRFLQAADDPSTSPDARASNECELKSLRDAMFKSVALLHLSTCMEILDRMTCELIRGWEYLTPAEAKKIYLDVYFWLTVQIKKDVAGACEECGEFNEVFARLQSCERIAEIHSCLALFIGNLMDMLSDREGSRGRLLVEKAKAHVSAGLATGVNLEETARFVGLSPGYLGKLFKKETGASFSEYLITSRIEKAKQLMSRDDKMWAIAMQIGYPDLSSFSRSFKKVTGVSPSHYKGRLAGSSDPPA